MQESHWSGIELLSLFLGIAASIYAIGSHETAADRRLKRALAARLERSTE